MINTNSQWAITKIIWLAVATSYKGVVDCFTHCQELEWGFYSIFFAKCIFYMFELREKFEKNHFLAILTPQNCNLVGPRRPSGQFSEIRVPTQWNPNFGIVVHCILPLHCYAVSVVLSRQNRKSGIPDFRFFPFASVAQSAAVHCDKGRQY